MNLNLFVYKEDEIQKQTILEKSVFVFLIKISVCCSKKHGVNTFCFV